MSHVVVVQPDGKFGIWSTVVDDWVLSDATEEDIEDFFVARAVRDAQHNVARAIDRARARPEGQEGTWPELERWRKKVHGGT